MINKLIVNFCTLFNLGFVKFMPGTIGSLVSLPLGYITLKFFGFWIFILIIILLILVSYFAISKYFSSDEAALTVPSVPSIACSSEIAIEWDKSFKNINDPSGRAVTGVHNK